MIGILCFALKHVHITICSCLAWVCSHHVSMLLLCVHSWLWSLPHWSASSVAACKLSARPCAGPSRRRGSRCLAIVALISPFNSPTRRVTAYLSCLVALLFCHHCPASHVPLSPWRTVPGVLACPVSIVIPSLTDMPLLPPPRSCPHAVVPLSCLGWSALSRGRGPRHCCGSTPSPSKSLARAPSPIPHAMSSIGS